MRVKLTLQLNIRKQIKPRMGKPYQVKWEKTHRQNQLIPVIHPSSLVEIYASAFGPTSWMNVQPSTFGLRPNSMSKFRSSAHQLTNA